MCRYLLSNNHLFLPQDRRFGRNVRMHVPNCRPHWKRQWWPLIVITSRTTSTIFNDDAFTSSIIDSQCILYCIRSRHQGRNEKSKIEILNNILFSRGRRNGRITLRMKLWIPWLANIDEIINHVFSHHSKKQTEDTWFFHYNTINNHLEGQVTEQIPVIWMASIT